LSPVLLDLNETKTAIEQAAQKQRPSVVLDPNFVELMNFACSPAARTLPVEDLVECYKQIQSGNGILV